LLLRAVVVVGCGMLPCSKQIGHLHVASLAMPLVATTTATTTAIAGAFNYFHVLIVLSCGQREFCI